LRSFDLSALSLAKRQRKTKQLTGEQHHLGKLRQPRQELPEPGPLQHEHARRVEPRSLADQEGRGRLVTAAAAVAAGGEERPGARGRVGGDERSVEVEDDGERVRVEGVPLGVSRREQEGRGGSGIGSFLLLLPLRGGEGEHEALEVGVDLQTQ
jgi:hypothetical protein